MSSKSLITLLSRRRDRSLAPGRPPPLASFTRQLADMLQKLVSAVTVNGSTLPQLLALHPFSVDPDRLARLVSRLSARRPLIICRLPSCLGTASPVHT